MTMGNDRQQAGELSRVIVPDSLLLCNLCSQCKKAIGSWDPGSSWPLVGWWDNGLLSGAEKRPSSGAEPPSRPSLDLTLTRLGQPSWKWTNPRGGGRHFSSCVLPVSVKHPVAIDRGSLKN